MTIDSPADLEGLRHIGRIVAQTLQAMKEAVRPGITTAELDQIADHIFKQNNARSAPRITYSFPGATCISVNDEAAHGIPGSRVIQPGDLVKLDASAECNGYFADAAITVAVPPMAPRQQKLYNGARAIFEAALNAVRLNQPISDIGRAADRSARRHGYRVIRELPGHGLGRSLHEDPQVPMTFDASATGRMTEGLVFTVEPHVAIGSARLLQEDDGWTLTTEDGGLVVAFEHTVVVTKGKPILITAL